MDNQNRLSSIDKHLQELDLLEKKQKATKRKRAILASVLLGSAILGYVGYTQVSGSNSLMASSSTPMAQTIANTEGNLNKSPLTVKDIQAKNESMNVTEATEDVAEENTAEDAEKIDAEAIDAEAEATEEANSVDLAEEASAEEEESLEDNTIEETTDATSLVDVALATNTTSAANTNSSSSSIAANTSGNRIVRASSSYTNANSAKTYSTAKSVRETQKTSAIVSKKRTVKSAAKVATSKTTTATTTVKKASVVTKTAASKKTENIDASAKVANKEEAINMPEEMAAVFGRSKGKARRPEYPGGKVELYKFLGKTVKYPTGALEEQVEGQVAVQIQLDARGKVIGSKVLKGIGYGCDEAVLKAIKQMPRWMPAHNGSENIGGVYNVAFRFRLPDLD